VIFIFASPAASSAYLSASEIFPLDTLAIPLSAKESDGFQDRCQHA
jgi:hypothetical protein